MNKSEIEDIMFKFINKEFNVLLCTTIIETGIDIPNNRINVHLLPGDVIIVCQVMGGRLPEGATILPEGITLKWIKVDIAVG